MERRHRPLGPYKRHELLTGEVFYPALGYTGYGDGSGTDLEAFIDENMKADWDANRDELMEFWNSGEYTTAHIFPDHATTPWLFICGTPDTLPWAAEMFDHGQQHR